MKRRARLAAFTLVVLGALAAPREVGSHNPITTTVRYNREIAKILGEKCVQCHTSGGMSMPLTTYLESRPWAEAIKEEILTRRMPPWPAERGYGDFANDVALTARERDFLLSWIDGGAPEGDGAPPVHMDHSGHWMLGQPDAIVTAGNGARIAPGTPPGFQRIVIETGFASDRWVRAIDYHPGDKRVTRAAFLTVAATGQYLGGWTPWQSSTTMPGGAAIKVPAGARIAVDTLYQAAEELVTDRPTVAFYFEERPTATVTSLVMQARADTDATAPVHRARAEFTTRQPLRLVGMRPELGAGARSLEIKVTQPDGSVQVVLWVKRFRPDWQTPYAFRNALALEPGATVRAIADFDAPHGGAELKVVMNAYPGQTPTPRRTRVTDPVAPRPRAIAP